jgi:hypothetical protein
MDVKALDNVPDTDKTGQAHFCKQLRRLAIAYLNAKGIDAATVLRPAGDCTIADLLANNVSDDGATDADFWHDAVLDVLVTGGDLT